MSTHVVVFNSAFRRHDPLCPQCEEGLYKVTARTNIDELVLDDGTLLQPLNTTIPKCDAWKALACPRCGGRYHKDGKLHTVQAGWQ